jgi:TfoX-like protein
MAYDEELAGRIRAALSSTDGVTEKLMFGGCAFLVAGHMVAAASRDAGLMLRLDPALGPDLVDGDRIRHVWMNGRELRGWLHLEPAVVEEEAQLMTWLQRGLDHVRNLPPK